MIYPKRQQAFILVTTLWMLAILTIAASFFAIWTQRAVDLAQDLQTDLQGEIDAYNTQAQLVYLFSTRRLTMAGLNPNVSQTSLNFSDAFDISAALPVGGEIALDDTVYQGIGTARFSIQDKAGLFSLHQLSIGLSRGAEKKAIKLLGILGVPTELRKTLVARLRDYVDADDFHQINGAEAAQYIQAGRPPPPNRLLLNPMECQAILGWKEQEDLWKDGVWGQISTTATAGFLNLNTAPALVLQSLEGISAETAKRVVDRRKAFGAFTGYLQFQQLIGVEVGGDAFTVGYRVYPSEFFRISTWHQNGQRIRQQHISLTPIQDQAKPWKVDYSADLALFTHQANAKPIKLDAVFINKVHNDDIVEN
ncbi:type II secretion system protein GspK [Candidatus Albibeggiatoa sp. nov. NOAA]|uniref:general secretion pathway protein GspK n=1 Tax=Candidatus Albibeggiatoa sp. nov. NOAA TaxID=3162724 RepID=UPI0032F3147B|nr:type II secretion system protein GspK [Thiotrichaceae bacterium]